MSHRPLVLCLLLAAATLLPAQAQQVDTSLVLDGVTVEATRFRPIEAPARIDVIGAAAIEASGAEDVGTLLEERSTVFVKRYGSTGLASLSLRGTAASQTLVLLDGHRFTDPQLGQVDLSLLPTLLLDRAEVLHGASAALYGSDALGGVVDLKTVAPGEGPMLRTRLSHGSYGAWSGGLLVGGWMDLFGARWSGVAAVEGDEQDGDYPYLDQARFPPAEVRRQGADRARASVYAAARAETERADVHLGVWGAEADRGLPNLSGPPRGERQEDSHRRLWADARYRLRSALTLLAGATLQRTGIRYLVQPPGAETPATDDLGTTRTALARLGLRAAPTPWLLMQGGVEGSLSDAAHPSLAADARERRFAAHAQATLAYGRLTVFPALRLDAVRLPAADTLTSSTALSPRLGLNVRLLADGLLHLKASGGRAFRVPTFNDRFWVPGGNPDLRPERGWTVDAGLAAHTPPMQRASLQAEVTAFAHRLRDQIVWLPRVDGVWAPRNLTRTRTTGLELSSRGTLRLAHRLRLRTHLVHTRTRARQHAAPDDATHRQPLRYVPSIQTKWGAVLEAGPLHAGFSHRYTSERFVSEDGRRSLPGYALLDLHAGAELRLSGVEARLTYRVENALDRRYRVLAGYPMPPRTHSLRLGLTF